MTKIYAFIFWIDFCVSIVPYPMGIQKVATWCPRIAAGILKTCVNAIVCSVFQVIDRIAETQQRRGLTREYNNHLTPASTTMKLQKSRQRYPDFAGIDWRPMDGTDKICSPLMTSTEIRMKRNPLCPWSQFRPWIQ
jgi:hypothetical protein